MKRLLSIIYYNLKWLIKNSKNVFYLIILLVIISSTSSILGIVQALVCKYLLDGATNHQNILKYIIALGVILLSTCLFNLIQPVITAKASNKVKNKIQSNLYVHIIKSKYLSSSKYHSVDLLTRTTNDVSTISTLISTTFPSIISFILMLIGSAVVLYNISPTMTIFAIIFFPILFLFSSVFAKLQKKYYLKVQKIESKYNSFIQESFNNLLIVKVFNQEKNRLASLNMLQNERYKTNIKSAYLSSTSTGILNFCSVFAYFVVMAWGTYNMVNGVNIYGSLTATLQLFSTIQVPLYGLTSTIPQLVKSFGAITRLDEITKLPLEDYSEKLQFNNKPINVEYNNVSFKFDDDNKLILNNINVSFKSGDIIGLVGPSGEGKTTMIRLLLSIIYPCKGKILINNHEINPNYRQLISYVPQGNTLFSGSIKDNITLGDDSITEKEITNSLKMACAYDFVNNLENKIDTVIGEKSSGISEGQAQRITIARALIRKRPILILDEATSSLDPKTEINIINTIKTLPYKPLCIIITHRPAALSICDKIYKLKDTKLTLTSKDNLI